MAIVNVGQVAAYTGGLNVQVSWLGREGRQPPGVLTYIHQDEPGELT